MSPLFVKDGFEEAESLCVTETNADVKTFISLLSNYPLQNGKGSQSCLHNWN